MQKLIRRILIILVITAALFACSASSFALSDPDASVLSFSVEPGFYDQAFDLEIRSSKPEIAIYYTFYGDKPSLNSNLYDDPIHIVDATGEENRYSMRTDISAGYLSEEIDKKGVHYSELSTPVYKIDKCTVIRAIAVDGNGKTVDEICGSYFVGIGSKDVYDGIKVISMVTDPENLFDEDRGIYVLGRGYKIFNFASKLLGRKDNWVWWEGNYSFKGESWERPAEIQVFDSKEYVGSSNCGIRVHGRISRARIPRSLAVYSRPEYSGKERFDFDFWGDGFRPDKFLLLGLEAERKMKETVVSDAVRGGNMDCMRYVPCIVFIDGEYWGSYTIAEKYDAEYVEEYYSIPAENVWIVKDNEGLEGGKQALRSFSRMYSFISGHDMTNEGNYAKALEMFDRDSFIEFFATKIYICDTDWPGKNYAAWKSNIQIEGNDYSDGKWRWMLFDMNHGNTLNDRYSEYDMVEHAIERDGMFRSLMENDGFRKAFLDKLRSMSENEFDPSAMGFAINDYSTTLRGVIVQENERFYGENATYTNLEFFESAGGAYQFFLQRKKYVNAVYTEDWQQKMPSKGIKGVTIRDLETLWNVRVLALFVLLLPVLIIIDFRRNGKKGRKKNG